MRNTFFTIWGILGVFVLFTAINRQCTYKERKIKESSDQMEVGKLLYKNTILQSVKDGDRNSIKQIDSIYEIRKDSLLNKRYN